MPENETKVSIKIFRRADWVSKSHFIVTISKNFGGVVTFTLTHSRLVLNSLSLCLRVFAISYILLYYLCKVLKNSISNCSSDV